MNDITKKQVVGRQINIILHALMSLEDLEIINHNDMKEIMNILYGKAVLK